MSGFQTDLFPPPPPYIDPALVPPGLRIGTSSWSTADWCGTFYSSGAKPAAYLVEYARQLGTVEIDSTFYGIPSEKTVQAWRRKTPDGFLFSAKVPRTITHDHYLAGGDDDFRLFLERMDHLGDRLGPILFQFPYQPRAKDPEEWETGRDFLARLEAFLPKLPADKRFAVEVRNDRWIEPPLLDLLRAKGIALVLLEYYTMPPVTTLLEKHDLVTGDFVYARFLGDHKAMDALVEGRDRPWGSLAVNRAPESERWVPVIRDFLRKPVDLFLYFNNHFAGHAPGSIRLFLEMLSEPGAPPPSGGTP